MNKEMVYCVLYICLGLWLLNLLLDNPLAFLGACAAYGIIRKWWASTTVKQQGEWNG